MAGTLCVSAPIETNCTPVSAITLRVARRGAARGAGCHTTARAPVLGNAERQWRHTVRLWPRCQARARQQHSPPDSVRPPHRIVSSVTLPDASVSICRPPISCIASCSVLTSSPAASWAGGSSCRRQPGAVGSGSCPDEPLQAEPLPAQAAVPAESKQSTVAVNSCSRAQTVPAEFHPDPAHLAGSRPSWSCCPA